MPVELQHKPSRKWLPSAYKLRTEDTGMLLASFPGPAQLSVTCSTEIWVGPGNEASMLLLTVGSVAITVISACKRDLRETERELERD